jgi:prepilin-type N-terminal cleavage/methylation domain-containing protein
MYVPQCGITLVVSQLVGRRYSVMPGATSRRRAFSLIEFVVTALIIGVLLAIAVPSYMSSVRASRAATANSNANALATAVQAKFIKAGGGSYVSFDGTSLQADATFATDLGGGIPNNPCTGNNRLDGSDFTVTAGASRWTIRPTTGSCSAGDLKTVQLGQ